MTAVELGADMCALARANARHGEIELLAAELLDPAAFPGIDAFTGAVRRTRKSLKLPRRCRAVVWGLPDGAKRSDPAVKPLIAPLLGAGFRVERVISPCNALAALARLKMSRGDNATCWLAINRTGVAIVVVRPGTQLYSHSFPWDSNVGSSGSQARLLQRYTLVAFLAPEIRRAMSAAREKGTPVDAIVTCGNLPEIRSLTMPLIEELDVEVESLDSFDGLIVKPDATDRLSELAAALRIACAGAIARPTRQWDESQRSPSALRSVGPMAAIVAVIVGVGFVGWSWWKMQSAGPPRSKPASATATSNQTSPTTAKQRPAPAIVAPKQDVNPRGPIHKELPPPITPTKQPSPPALKQAAPIPPKQPVPRAQPPAGVPNQLPHAATKQAPSPPPQQSAAKPDPGPKGPTRTSESKRSGPIEPKKPVQSNPPAAVPAAPPPLTHGALNSAPRPADKPDVTPVRTVREGQGRARSLSPAPMPELLKDPVPRVTAILVSSDRRIATIDDGRIISVGEALGKRVVVAIDERAVVLKEPSGVQIRVGLGGRILGVERER